MEGRMFDLLRTDTFTLGDALTITVPDGATRTLLLLNATAGAAYYEAADLPQPAAQVTRGDVTRDLPPLDLVTVDTAPGETITVTGTGDATVTVSHYALHVRPATPGATLDPAMTQEADHE